MRRPGDRLKLSCRLLSVQRAVSGSSRTVIAVESVVCTAVRDDATRPDLVEMRRDDIPEGRADALASVRRMDDDSGKAGTP